MEEVNKRQEVYEVFKEYFGEDRVDLQTEGKLIVYFPTVTVTNEIDESIVITDLYVQIKLSTEGLIYGTFEMTRGSYTLSQVLQDYIHSHAFTIPEENAWSKVCLGNGPIIHTISVLSTECDLDRWELFCFELDKYVTVESEIGIPYHRLRNVSRSAFTETSLDLKYDYVRADYAKFPIVLEPFLSYLINKDVLQFTQVGNHWYIAQSFTEYISVLTSVLKEYIIENNLDSQIFFNNGILRKGLYKNDKFITKELLGRRAYTYDLEGRIACTFKGNVIRISVTNDIIEVDDSRDLIVDPKLANFILYKVLNVLNYGSIAGSEDSPTEEDGTVVI